MKQIARGIEKRWDQEQAEVKGLAFDKKEDSSSSEQWEEGKNKVIWVEEG